MRSQAARPISAADNAKSTIIGTHASLTRSKDRSKRDGSRAMTMLTPTNVAMTAATTRSGYHTPRSGMTHHTSANAAGMGSTHITMSSVPDSERSGLDRRHSEPVTSG